MITVFVVPLLIFPLIWGSSGYICKVVYSAQSNTNRVTHTGTHLSHCTATYWPSLELVIRHTVGSWALKWKKQTNIRWIGSLWLLALLTKRLVSTVPGFLIWKCLVGEINPQVVFSSSPKASWQLSWWFNCKNVQMSPKAVQQQTDTAYRQLSRSKKCFRLDVSEQVSVMCYSDTFVWNGEKCASKVLQMSTSAKTRKCAMICV